MHSRAPFGGADGVDIATWLNGKKTSTLMIGATSVSGRGSRAIYARAANGEKPRSPSANRYGGAGVPTKHNPDLVQACGLMNLTVDRDVWRVAL
jgi:hypothetical protein